jgi:[acyl-carrier-protein] S-malonyltransferase
MTVAWLFPGQGSQTVGMAMAWAGRSSAAAAAVTEATDVLGFDLASLMRQGPADELDRTDNAQPAILAASVAIMRAARDTLGIPQFVAGHSMGEYSALVAAGSLEYATALRLVRRRGELMREAGDRTPGGMAAILGLGDAAVEEVCERVGGVQVANYNAPGQVVISGTYEGVARATDALRAAGAKRVVPLAVSIAAHSALMAPAAEAFAAEVAAAPIAAADPPLVANTTALPATSPADIATELAASLQQPVRWTESVRWMAASGVTAFVEIGPGSVLTALVKRILRDGDESVATAVSLAEPAEVQAGSPGAP